MIYLDVACNDPANGLNSGHAEMLQIGHTEFEPRYYPRSPRFVEEQDHIVISGKSWPIASSKYWVGNWCWNRYQLANPKQTPRWTMTYFLIWLRRRRLYHCTVSFSEFRDWFDSEVTIPPAEIHKLVCELEKPLW